MTGGKRGLALHCAYWHNFPEFLHLIGPFVYGSMSNQNGTKLRDNLARDIRLFSHYDSDLLFHMTLVLLQMHDVLDG